MAVHAYFYSLVRNVHGVRADFLATGARRGSLERGDPAMRRGAYFLGKPRFPARGL
ncbi:hypothetical protein T492DRAFT_862880 [Pavlovales sp. CCMP2436]|nr:hypothetical protein T492DRAFT_862880 [Pavlovales sp. CCMP2436]